MTPEQVAQAINDTQAEINRLLAYLQSLKNLQQTQQGKRDVQDVTNCGELVDYAYDLNSHSAQLHIKQVHELLDKMQAFSEHHHCRGQQTQLIQILNEAMEALQAGKHKLESMLQHNV